MFSAGESVRPEGGRQWTVLSRPVRSLFKLALQPGPNDHSPAVPRRKWGMFQAGPGTVVPANTAHHHRTPRNIVIEGYPCLN